MRMSTTSMNMRARITTRVTMKITTRTASTKPKKMASAEPIARTIRFSSAVHQIGLLNRRTYWPYLAQKDYVYLQPLAPNAGYDLRVLVVGDYAFGVYRAVPKGEFRASGMHTAYYDALPAEAMLLARRVRDRLGVLMLALDMLVDERRERYSIIELSMFTQTPDPWYLRVDDVPGLYVFAGDAFEFVSGHVLLQHLILEELLKQRWIAPRLLAPEAAAISGEGATGTA